jgi:hypothetical protein
MWQQQPTTALLLWLPLTGKNAPPQAAETVYSDDIAIRELHMRFRSSSFVPYEARGPNTLHLNVDDPLLGLTPDLNHGCRGLLASY